jgi:hypothetical protein
MDQCNGCGAFDDLRACEFCVKAPSLFCLRCKAPHERICEENQKRIKRGEGPTVRMTPRQQMPPIPAAPNPVDQGLQGVADLLNEN